MANIIEAKGMNPEATLRYWMTAISVNVQINIDRFQYSKLKQLSFHVIISYSTIHL